MLKNKKAVYLLVPLNITIWGFFIYRFYTAYYEGDVVVENDNVVAVKAEIQADSVVYDLKLNYNDPFLKDMPEKRHHNNLTANSLNTIAAQPSQVKPPAEPPKQAPEIKYMGLIKNTSTGQAAALVSINGQSRLMKQNDVADYVTIKSFNRDSLVVKWGKERIVIRK